MYMAISRFKVANGIEESVADAFRNRPRLVDQVSGFVDMEVYCPVDDASEFWLLTRWENEAAFLAWHHSDAHKASHQGIPKGLKLDPKATFVRHFHRLTA